MIQHIFRTEIDGYKYGEELNCLKNREWKHIIARYKDYVEVHAVYKDSDGNLYDTIIEKIDKIKESK